MSERERERDGGGEGGENSIFAGIKYIIGIPH